MSDDLPVVAGKSELGPANPMFVRINPHAFESPALWTTIRGDSMFSFELQVDMRALLSRAGITNMEMLAEAVRRDRYNTRTGYNPNDNDEPAVIYSRIHSKLERYINGALQPICGGTIHGGGGSADSLTFNPYLTFNINVPADRAIAMAALFKTEKRREGFVEPGENKPLTGIGAQAAPATLDEFMDILNNRALAAVEMRNDIDVQSPAEWGPLGPEAGEFARQIMEGGEPRRVKKITSVVRDAHPQSTPRQLP